VQHDGSSACSRPAYSGRRKGSGSIELLFDYARRSIYMPVRWH
jgi:hypothetical protein